MLSMRCSVDSPLSVSELADRIRTEPRWGWRRDGVFESHRYLIADRYPVEVGPDGFRFVVPSSHRLWVVCRGRFHPSASGTRVELRFSLPRAMAVGVPAVALPFAAVAVVGLWPVNPWLAAGGALAVVAPVLAIHSFAFWWNARRTRQRVTELLTRLPAPPPATTQ